MCAGGRYVYMHVCVRGCVDECECECVCAHEGERRWLV